jgi:hypothetical protein
MHDLHWLLPPSWCWGQGLGAESFTSFFLVLTSREAATISVSWTHPGQLLSRAHKHRTLYQPLEHLPCWRVCHIFIRIADARRHAASLENLLQRPGDYAMRGVSVTV